MSSEDPPAPLPGGGQCSLISPLPHPQTLPGHIPRPRRDVEVPIGRLRRQNSVAMAAGASLEPQRRVRFGWVGPGGEGLQPGGAGGGGRGAAGGPCQAHRFPPFRRGALPCPLLPHPGPKPTSQARPLPDVGAAQGEPQQVERSAAHAQADEADHRDELREDRGHCPSVPSPAAPPRSSRRPLRAFLPGDPHPA